MSETASAAPGPPAPSRLARVRAALPLTRLQAIVGLIAGTLSIGLAMYSLLFPGTPPPPQAGSVIALVQDARSSTPVPDATVEVLTPQDALVTTLTGAAGRTQGSLREGTYRLRVSHPRYATETRPIQIIAGHTAQVHVRLAPRPAAPPAAVRRSDPAPVEAVKKGVDALRRVFE